MRKIVTLAALLLFLGSISSFAGNYKLDQNKIDAMMVNAQDVAALSVFDLGALNSLPVDNAQLKEKDPLIAFLLTATVGVGVAGIHRLYLGTETMTFIVYLLTLGGCGIIQTVDSIMLLLVLIDDEKSIAPYLNNPEIIMWKNQVKSN